MKFDDAVGIIMEDDDDNTAVVGFAGGGETRLPVSLE